MPIARLHGGPLDGELLPLDDADLDSYIAPYGEGQLVYRKQDETAGAGETAGTGEDDGPTATDLWFVESTEDINPDVDGRDD